MILIKLFFLWSGTKRLPKTVVLFCLNPKSFFYLSLSKIEFINSLMLSFITSLDFFYLKKIINKIYIFLVSRWHLIITIIFHFILYAKNCTISWKILMLAIFINRLVFITKNCQSGVQPPSTTLWHCFHWRLFRSATHTPVCCTLGFRVPQQDLCSRNNNIISLRAQKVYTIQVLQKLLAQIATIYILLCLHCPGHNLWFWLMFNLKLIL